MNKIVAVVAVAVRAVAVAVRTVAVAVRAVPAVFLMQGVLVNLNCLQAQSIRTISTNDGLPQSFVSGLVQDDSSFIWVGTRNGLARYDGIRFKVFQHHPGDSNSISANVIIWIEKDQNNKIWIEHESGDIDRFDPVTEKFSHILKANTASDRDLKFVRRGWMMDNDGIFWGIKRGDGLNSYDTHTGIKKKFNRSNSNIDSDTIRGLLSNRAGLCWFISQKSISIFDKKQNRFISWPVPWPQDYGVFEESDAIAIDLHERHNGELMWGDRNCVYFFNPSNKKFRKIAVPVQGYLGVRWIRSGNNHTDYLENFGKIYAYNDSTGLVVVGNSEKHVFGDVKSFLVDRSGIIWTGTNARGIRQIDLATPFFYVAAYESDFATDMLKKEFGIDIGKLFNWTAADQSFTLPGYHLRTAYDRDRRLYLALKETVCYYDRATHRVTVLPHVPVVDDPAEKGIGIKGISILDDGSPVVIGYNRKILVYRFAKGSWENLVDPMLISRKSGSQTLPRNLYIRGNTCWITTENDGLLKLDLVTHTIQQFKSSKTPGSLPTNQLLSLNADPVRKEILWIGSYEGLIAFDTKENRCEVFSVNDNLPDNTIYSILNDRSGKLWVSTNKGIARFDPATKNVRVFKTQHGLPGDEFNRFHHMLLPDGSLVFGGTEGWIRFNEQNLKDDEYEPAIALTNLKINNQEVMSGVQGSALPVPLNAIKELHLPYEKNTITINFAGLEFSQPEDLEYRYKLEGYDKDWVLSGHERQASYTKIPPGTYTLLVNASNTTGKWSPIIKALQIRIQSPWWATWIAYLCYAIIIGGLIWMFIRFRVSKMLMERDLVLNEKETLQLKEMDDIKSRFFSNITHEFRTPLTLILGPAEQLKNGKPGEPGQHQLADTILANARQLLSLINRLMDLSKLEARTSRLTEQSGNPGELISAVISSFLNDAGSRGVNIRFSDEAQLNNCWFYADAVERIAYNLISNALKFTPAGGSIKVILSSVNDKLTLTVQDTGIGIADQDLPYIFNRFYQAGGETMVYGTKETGTGIGLAIVKELVEQMQGKISVESKTGTSSGTKFVLEFPARAWHGSSSSVRRSEPFVTGKISGDNGDEMSSGDSSAIPKILLVEDNRELAAFVENILRPHYEVTQAPNGEQALDLLLSVMPDLVITDIMMPVMDGYRFTSLAKEDIRTAHIPVIMLTAKTSHQNLVTGLVHGADEYLTKPFHPSELLLRIRNILRRQEKLRDHLREQLISLPATPVNEAATLPLNPDPVIEDIFLVKLYARLDDHLEDPQFGVDQLAEIMNISRSSLHRKLKTLTGMTTTEVVRNYRLKKAIGYLRVGFNSAESAYKTGFSSPAYFTKSFREVYGVTPGEYVQGLTQ